ncbi:MAG: tRNA guanosine(34) transglycosylase Tgt [Candidatus Kerfeldbacteria bacterium]
MISFTVTSSSKRSRARAGILTTPHGTIETPALVGVATQATIKALTMDQVLETGTQALICNTFHLHLKPGEKIVRAHGGLHTFMHWNGPLMTDSGGFQVFSLGFGRDLNMGKILRGKRTETVTDGVQPRSLTITRSGVHFRSPIDGRPVFLGPKRSIAIQQALGADIMFAFDECPPPVANIAYLRRSLERTHRWALASLEARTTKQALYGIVQGGAFRTLRKQSASYITALPFDGFGIGGELGGNKKRMASMLGWMGRLLPHDKPRHLLGTGHPEDLLGIVRSGVDTFDSIAPTHYARHGIAFTSKGRLDLTKSAFLRDRKPLDPSCACTVCARYTRSYIAHLFRAKEITPLSLVSFHNLFYYNALLTKLRQNIKKGTL